MTFIDELLNQVSDAVLREELQERIDIVVHKIKFMDKVPVACLNTENDVVYLFSDVLSIAGGFLQTDIEGAVYVIYHQEDKELSTLMGVVPNAINPAWQAAQNKRIALLNQNAYKLNNAEGVVDLIEDIAEILHPGYFIFGHEGDKWIRFEV